MKLLTIRFAGIAWKKSEFLQGELLILATPDKKENVYWYIGTLSFMITEIAMFAVLWHNSIFPFMITEIAILPSFGTIRFFRHQFLLLFSSRTGNVFSAKVNRWLVIPGIRNLIREYL